MKTCTKCGNKYPANAQYFSRKKTTRDGLSFWCKLCHSEYLHKHYEANRDKYLESARKRRETKPGEVAKGKRKWRRGNPEKMAESRQKYLIMRWGTNPEGYREWVRQRNYRHREQFACRLSDAIAHGIWGSIKQKKNGRHWEDLVGYTCDELMTHLATQFTRDMTFDNYGDWHIDHIKPVSHFHFDSPKDPEFKECWSLWNLQPLWAFGNLRKHAKCDAPPLPLITRRGM